MSVGGFTSHRFVFGQPNIDLKAIRCTSNLTNPRINHNPHIWLIMLALALILLSLAQAADYFYQADLHGWYNPLWVNGTRAPKWGWLDFIPHDGWHIAQTLRNFGDAAGVTLACIAISSLLWHSPLALADIGYMIICLSLSLAVRALLRGLFFSLPYKVWKKK